ncbi:MAG: S-layer homology domain-containing protein [Desulfotomaculaceae bacterium]|nr:S-layer homology domain-containing protein [Desulfotomaculaceae bacterium]
MKKTLCLVFVVCLLFSLITGAAYAAGDFDDVGENEWFFSGVKYVSTNEILQGVTDTVFEPNAAIDRSTFIAALYKYSVMKGYDVSVWLDTNILSYEDAFDIKEGSFEAFQWACGSGLIPEPDAGATSLGIHEIMSREQLVIFLYDYAVLYGIDPTAGENTNILSYTDVSDMSQEQGYEAFQWACGAGIIVGTSASTIDPSGSLTRAQLATVLMRLSTK